MDGRLCGESSQRRPIRLACYQTKAKLTQMINYGPKDDVNRRGGDVLIEVDVHDATIKSPSRAVDSHILPHSGRYHYYGYI